MSLLKKSFYLLLLLFFCSFYFSCSQSNDFSNTDLPNDNNEQETSDLTKMSVKITNNTDCKIDIYSNPLRDSSQLVCSINKNSSKIIQSNTQGEVVYYLTFYVDIGIEIPWSDNSSVIIVDFKPNQIIEKEINYPSKMENSSSYVVLQNKSNQPIQFMRGESIILSPVGLNSNSVLSNYDDVGVYEITDASTSANYQLDLFNVRNALDKSSFSFPLSFKSTGFSKSMIYSFCFDGKSLNLVSVIPFNQDTKKKIWSWETLGFDSNNFVSQVFRARFNPKNGSILMGEVNKNDEKYGLVVLLDEYGQLDENFVKIELDDKSKKNFIDYDFIDILEDSNSNFIILFQAEFTDKIETYMICREKNGVTKWITKLEGTLFFRKDSKNKLIEIGNNEYAVCGQIFHSNNLLSFFLSTIKYDGENIHLNYFIGENPTNIENKKEQIFSSMIFNTETQNFICVGYDNFNGKYNQNDMHTGIIYEINKNLTESKILFSKNGTLFLGIDKDKNQDWYACGEFTDSGNSLFGCVIFPKMNKNNDLFIYNNKEKSHSWFNQICVEENRILLCGQISNDFSGESANAWVLAINDNGEELWNNLYDEKYNCVFSCMKNGIGSLLMELYNTNSGNAKIISSDLLCDDTGLCLGTIK